MSPRKQSPESRSKRSRKSGRKAPKEAEAAARVRADPATGEPRTIGSYRVLRVLGEGGMGTVYLAEQTGLGRRVAVKLIRPALVDRDAARRFTAERQALARMHHPYIAQVFDAGTTDDGQPFIAMEYIPGLPISRHCETQKPDLPELLRLFITVGQALLHAHKKGTIHRDVKPSNILVMEVDGRAIPKVIDFGIAKMVDRSLAITDVGAVVGTVAYMSPEQIRGATLDTRSDVYSYGVLVHELLTGQLPEVNSTLEAALWKGYPEELHQIVSRCLLTDPDQRYADFGELIEELGTLLDDLRSSERGESAASLVRHEELGERLMRETWATFDAALEAAEDPTAAELLALFEQADEAPQVLRDLVRLARHLVERNRRALAGESRLAEAVADCRLALVLSPGHRSRTQLLEQAVRGLQKELGELEEAQDADACCHLGDALAALGQAEEADRVYVRALEIHPKSAHAYYGQGTLLWDDPERQRRGLSACWKTLDLVPYDAPSHNNLGVALYFNHFQPGVSHFGQDKLKQSIDAFRRAVDLDPALAVGHRNLGLALFRKNDREGAREALARAAELSEDSADSKLLESLLESDERLGEAIEDGRLQPEGVAGHVPGKKADRDDTSGRSLARRGRLDQARAAFLRSERRRREATRSTGREA